MSAQGGPGAEGQNSGARSESNSPGGLRAENREKSQLVREQCRRRPLPELGDLGRLAAFEGQEPHG